MRRKITQDSLNKANSADLKLTTALAEAREKNNKQIDQMFESLFAMLMSFGMTAMGFKAASLYINSFSHAKKWIADEKDKEALPWMINLASQYPSVWTQAKDKQGLLSLYHDFQKVITKWDARIASMGSDEIAQTYGDDNIYLIQAIFKDISEILDTKDSTLVDKFYKIGAFANQQGIFNIELRFSYFLAFSIPIIRHAILEPALKPLLHKIYDLRFIGEPTYLSDIKARALLVKAEKEYYQLDKWSKKGVAANYFFASIALAISLTSYYKDGKWPAPHYMLFVSTTIVKILIDQMHKIYQEKKQLSLTKTLNSIENDFNNILSFTKVNMELHRGRNLKDCYLTYRATKYQALSDVLVNQIVKNVFLKNNILIIEYTKVTQSFTLPILTSREVANIKLQIEQALSLRLEIKLNGPSMMKQLMPLPINKAINANVTSSLIDNNDDEDNAANIYFSSMLNNSECTTSLVENFNYVEKLLVELEQCDQDKSMKNSFLILQRFQLDNLKDQYKIVKNDENIILNEIRINPIISRHKKSHLQVVKRLSIVEKHLLKIQLAGEEYNKQRQDKINTPALAVPVSVSAPSIQTSISLSNTTGTLFAPTRNEKSSYIEITNSFAAKLKTYCDFTVSETKQILGHTIQINALLFEIVEFMKVRSNTHARLINEPENNFSKYIEVALSHSKNFIDEESVVLLHPEVIQFSQELIKAIAKNNFDSFTKNGFYQLMQAHGAGLETNPEVISDDDVITYTLITGSMINTFKDYDLPLPKGMLYSAMRMVNLKAEIYEGYVLPLEYLEHMANSKAHLPALSLSR